MLDVISEHQKSKEFDDGKVAGLFYRQKDPDLEKVVKVVHDREGNPHIDRVSPNHKITSNLFNFFIDQIVTYELGNGVIFEDESIKEQLGGTEFDYALQQILTYSMCDGKGFGLVLDDGITPFCFACKINGNEPFYKPIPDAYTGEYRAGVRYWRLADDKPLTATLYEPDGYTEYQETDEKTLAPIGEKQHYNGKTISNDIEGVYRSESTDKNILPVVTMEYINNQSEIVGNRSSLFAYDVMLSGLVNDAEAANVYWKIKHADAMDRVDDRNFINDLINGQVIHEIGEAEITKEEITHGNADKVTVVNLLRGLLFENFAAVDVMNISGGSKTATEIKSSYENLNRKCDKIEYFLIQFVKKCLKIKGLDENATFHFKRPNSTNESEHINTLNSVSPLLGEETTLEQVAETLGLGDSIETIKERKTAEAMARASLLKEGTGDTGD